MHDTNVHEIFSALNLTIIFIKPFPCIITQPSPFFNEILFLHSTFSFEHTMMDHCLTGTAEIHASISDIPSQIHPSPITLWQVIISFMLFVLSAQEITFWLIH